MIKIDYYEFAIKTQNTERYKIKAYSIYEAYESLLRILKTEGILQYVTVIHYIGHTKEKIYD